MSSSTGSISSSNVTKVPPFFPYIHVQIGLLALFEIIENSLFGQAYLFQHSMGTWITLPLSRTESSSATPQATRATHDLTFGKPVWMLLPDHLI